MSKVVIFALKGKLPMKITLAMHGKTQADIGRSAGRTSTAIKGAIRLNRYSPGIAKAIADACETDIMGMFDIVED